MCRTEKRDARREAKALTAAKLETSIEQELLNRLKQGTYGDIYNFDQKVYERVLEAAEVRPFPVLQVSHCTLYECPNMQYNRHGLQRDHHSSWSRYA